MLASKSSKYCVLELDVGGGGGSDQRLGELESFKVPVCINQCAPQKSRLPNVIKRTLDKGAATLWRWFSL